jgi:hypothetical protein
MLFREQQPVGQETGPADQGALCGDASQLWKIIVFR